ncbi:SIR2 family protein [Burkholderia sp. MSMB1498]|uniref:SIR2 family protein n=1 Tax=Burkholderia sp. MSMB1498 TaxID=1637842 RepID=UPI0018D2498C|nr:SIR2 family protein [Burkholderia sp. MSMB1498]
MADDLISRLSTDRDLSHRLIVNPNFEGVLGDLQREWANTRQDAQRQRLDRMQEAIRSSFDDMNRMLADQPGLEFPGAPIFAGRTVADFLARFDAIFTLNQDLLLELHYRPPMLPVGRGGWADRPQFPGMRVPQNFWALRATERLVAEWRPLPEADYRVEGGCQPVFKLHGSVNWRSANDGDLLVMGANKVEAIAGSSLLTWYADEFRARLREPGSRLMTIGYGFGDQHINNEIVEAANNDPTFGLFVVDPNGRKVLRPRSEGQIPLPPQPIEGVRYIGGSTRPLRSTFTGDELERGKLMRFWRIDR